jgi:hypothetical protein
VALHTTPTIDKYTVKEVLNKVINTDADALKVDIDNVTLKTEGSDINIEVHTDKAEDSMMIWTHTVKTGTGGTSYVPLVDSDGHLQVDTLSSALPSGAATAANQVTIIGHVDGVETLITSTNSKIDTFDAVLDSILVKNTEIDAVLDTIKIDTEAIETAVELLDNAIDGTEMQVDVVAALPSGSNTIGVVDLGSTDNAVLDAIAASLALLDNSIASGNELQVDVVASLPAGSAAIGKLAANSGVDIGDVDVTSIVPGTGATNLGKAEDAAHSSGDTGVMPLAVRNDDIAALSGADGDYSPMQVNAAGSLYTVDETGAAGSILVTGTSAVAATISGTCFVAIQFIEDTIFDSTDGLVATDATLYPDDAGTGAGISSGGGGAASDGVTFPQGMTIFGRWSGFKLTATGSVIAYIGYI